MKLRLQRQLHGSYGPCEPPRCDSYCPARSTQSTDRPRCEEQGHQLAVISSKTDFLAVLEALSGLTSTFSAWIGGRQLPGTGKYVWVDGSEVSFDGWIEGEPSQLRQETCLEASKLSSGRWNDQKCNMYRPYICMIAGGDSPGPGGGGWRVFGIVCLAAVAALAVLGAAVWGARSYLSRPRHRRMSAASDQRRYHARENPAYADTERSLNVSVSDDDVDGSGLDGGQSWPLRGGELEEHPL
ncbi:C-type lectin 1 [Amphibalanus amphitrite]|uniref:C-type lectin 1 n=1 Tax=Amphibalanus amphitrite TaxID=1232801 RepID=A0A6A4WT61_AMPAM|nr:C-type lectin 1 [Amphibalanus amphitrite]